MKIQFNLFLAAVLSCQLYGRVLAQPAHAKGQLKKFQVSAEGDADIELYEGGPAIKCRMKNGKGRGNPRGCQSGFTSITVVDTDCNKSLFGNPNKNKKCFAASITEGETGKIYHINRDGEISERDSSEYPEEEHPPNEGEPPEKHSDQRSLRLRGGQAGSKEDNDRSLQGTPVIDILVVYTQGAKADAQNHADGPIGDLVDLAIAETNAAYANSGIDAEVRLARLHEDASGYAADVGSSSMAPSLYHLTNTAGSSNDPNGLLDYVHQMRTDVGADMVVLITTGAGCGIAWLSGNCETCNPSASSQFSVTKYSCATGYYSFGHELGHNMGCNHDKGTSNVCGSSDSRYGYRAPNGSYRSILSYACATGQCDNNPGGSCTRLPFFSNSDPNYLWNGQPMGNPAGVGIGETNNAKRINERAEYISNFYASSEPTPPPTPNPPGPPTTSAPTKEPTPNPTSPPPTPCPGVDIKVDILTDNYPLETSWGLINTCTGQTQEFAGAYQAKVTQYSNTYCVPSAEYRFEISDTYGDGICCSYGVGNYEVFLDGVSVASGGEFASLESATFGSCGPAPTNSPSPAPTKLPTDSPIPMPSKLPTTSPTTKPSDAPTTQPTKSPTDSPTPAPSKLPTTSPTPKPSDAPTTQPTKLPTKSPTPVPTNLPTISPTPVPSYAPTTQPTKLPTNSPLPAPTNAPTAPEPTKNPTSAPSNIPTVQPTSSPSSFPTTSPMKKTTSQPTTLPPTPSQVVATFDSSLRVPKCAVVGSSCTSGQLLLDGKANNIEPNPPNTLDSCTDGRNGAYHIDESIDEITVYTVEGGLLQAGATAEIEAKVWAWRDGSADTADFYYAADANAPNWQYIGSVGAGGSNLRTLTAQYTLPNNALQAVRVNYRYGGSTSSCSGGSWDDVDDLVFSVAAGGAAAASSKKPLPTLDTEPLPTSHCATIDKWHKDRCDENPVCEWTNKREKGCYPKK